MKEEGFKISVQDERIECLRTLQLSYKQEEADTKMSTGKYEWMLNVIESSLDEDLIRFLPGLHAFSGCDSTSVFHGIGKIKWLNLVKKHEIFCDGLCLLGESLDIEETVYDIIEQMVCTA